MNPETKALVEAARKVLTLADEVVGAQDSPTRGDWGVECPLCMGELIERTDLDTIEALRSALSAVEAEAHSGVWRTTDSAPRDGTWFLAHGDGYGWEDCTFVCEFADHLGGFSGWTEVPGDKPAQPTHWQPLPAPPVKNGASSPSDSECRQSSQDELLPQTEGKAKPSLEQIARVIARHLTGDFAGAFLATEEHARIEACTSAILALISGEQSNG